MRVLLQRVTQARVEVASEVVGQIGEGLLLLVGIEPADTAKDVAWMSAKVSKLRVFGDADGVMNRSVLDSGGEVLAVSQFTLFGSYRNGNRPSWMGAARGEQATGLFDAFVEQMAALLGKPVPTGVFGADMQVHLVNDGPVTLMLDSRNPE
ncbi:D-aminoacyl-tRNA deacylase [Amantichitinum ursilacus]|uniref:D-aminoacyl-tRNA deacylase n=1 Tax=Amantichitinum ursilacus TaxID=857265 RepID=A0A0N0GPT4_9NEIS|nr:D-aminoacyl-tRNA deacylase [Amantichitinum ursilacus]KPC54032.1 D-tyrosyl-tRNA(Tyr) deacylase [Amantichitinum ursilacus]